MAVPPLKHLDGRLIKVERTEVTKPGQDHEVPGMGMPIFKKPGMLLPALYVCKPIPCTSSVVAYLVLTRCYGAIRRVWQAYNEAGGG
eukprot:1478590-Rhodomonas_salina.1